MARNSIQHKILEEIFNHTGAQISRVNDLRSIIITSTRKNPMATADDDYDRTFHTQIIKNPILAYAEFSENILISLALVNCNMKSIPEFILNYSTLKVLSLRNCNISSIDERITELRQLEILDISQNLLTVIPKSIFSLPDLQYLNLSKNSITTLPDEINHLRKLRGLILNDNQLKEIPLSILEMTELWQAHEIIRQIREEKNRIVRSQKYEEAAKLRDYERNQMELGYIGINLSNNDIQNLPPELLEKGRNKIDEYLKSLDGLNSLPVNEFKLLLIGEGGSGKTSLLKRLTANEFDINEKQTHGINIRSWELNSEEQKIKANIWDFGGQEIMHSTHQFFLSSRSLYVIVIDCRKEERIEHWLKHIEALAANSPTIIAINKIDEHPGFDLNRKFLIEKYPNIYDVCKVSCNTGHGIDTLKQVIISATKKIVHLNTLWPRTWFELKETLENANDNFISFDSFIDKCNNAGVYTKNAQETLLEFLHDLGVMLHFKDFGLKDTNVLNPHWVTSGVYKIVNSKELAERLGILPFDRIAHILPSKEYPLQKHEFLVALMEKFELCYKLNIHEMLVPDLLSVQEPDFEIETSLEFIVKYNFLPRSIFPKFVVRMKNDIKESLAWRSGVVIESKKAKNISKVIVDYEEKSIHIKVGGQTPRDYFSVIYHTLTDINNTFSNLVVSERIPIGKDNLSVGYDHLKNLEQLGVFKYIPEGANFEIDVSETLGSYTKSRKEQIEAEILKALNDIKDKMIDREGLMHEANKVLELKPNIMGMGIDLNALIDKYLRKKKLKNTAYKGPHSKR